MATKSRLLLDTSVFLWAVDQERSLSSVAASALADESATLFVSVASVWEMQIKHSLGKLPLSQPAEILVKRFAATLQVSLLDISLDHIGQLYNLPNVHRDPFDRMIIAQALAESLTIVSPDASFKHYPVKLLW